MFGRKARSYSLAVPPERHAEGRAFRGVHETPAPRFEKREPAGKEAHIQGRRPQFHGSSKRLSGPARVRIPPREFHDSRISFAHAKKRNRRRLRALRPEVA